MIKKFFRGLNLSGVSYLLISGQATVIYGAASFSEDIDLWVEPEVKNWNKFLKFLNSLHVRIYKLTPPITEEFILKGHGFHFKLFSSDEKPPIFFIDVMGVVPRAGNFKNCIKNVRYQKTDWGRLPVMGLRDLVEIKKTTRLEDYAVISNLVKIEYENLSSQKIKPTDWKWILTNSFEAEDLLFYLENNKEARIIGKVIERPCVKSSIGYFCDPKKSKKYFDSASQEIAMEIEELRNKDREYWRLIINDLKMLNKKKQFLPIDSKPPKTVIE